MNDLGTSQLIRHNLETQLAFHPETMEKIGRFSKWCIFFIYCLQSGVYAIYTTCASIGKLLSLVYICIYSANDLVPLTIKCNFFHRDYYSCVRITRGTIVMTFCTQSRECIQQELQHPCHPATSWALPALQAVKRTDNLHLRDLLAVTTT